MTKRALPRFTAEACLGRTFNPSISHSLNARFVPDGERIHPAIWPGPRSASALYQFQYLKIHPELLKYFACYYNCYANCIKNWPGYEANCQGVAQTCCTYGYHCSYCEP
jgi:hypothetical protein